MKNFIQKGEVLEYPNSGSEEVKSGNLVIAGSLSGVAVTDIPVGETGSVSLKGVFELPKAAGAISQGAKLYWVTADKNLSTTASGNTLIGFAWAAALAGDTTVRVVLSNAI